ncbi:DUF456 domain-containing protein [Nesterenkonia sp. LB17]|uniref:DUF456 domain-containing protein n=1 Tax=unclassified Nesterenkonia TaxID=2629769 RepID=UPI001F4D128E|nr:MULTISPECIES: DUF456 domain-containing protein [unclassified Nesterenkonia]MCH8564074.1 DUF456 domain-containing protein [Nesterenkonia sp. YGD6]MCH8566401.1 DUF456 domain-containing protein [Nesterenkonia sp. LB17]MCH8572129.1 DUF456 domain-containing protein [Nesterenkonia sp. AY15]
MLDSSAAEAITTVIAGLLLVIGALGVVLPILPGSLLIIITLIVWALLLGGPVVWTTAIIGVVLAVIGWGSSTVLTGRSLHRQQIPRGPIMIAVVTALVGLIVFPPLGLFIGFAAGLFGAEFVRRERDWLAAGTASLHALRAVGLGILLEFLLAGLAISAFLIGSLINFVS